MRKITKSLRLLTQTRIGLFTDTNKKIYREFRCSGIGGSFNR